MNLVDFLQVSSVQFMSCEQQAFLINIVAVIKGRQFIIAEQWSRPIILVTWYAVIMSAAAAAAAAWFCLSVSPWHHFDATRCHADALFLRLHSRGEGDRNRQSPLRQLNYLAGT